VLGLLTVGKGNKLLYEGIRLRNNCTSSFLLLVPVHVSVFDHLQVEQIKENNLKVGCLHPVVCTRSGSGFPSNATLV
jgi:hypothetical protein